MKNVVRVSQEGKFIRKRLYEDLWPIIVSRGIITEFVDELMDYPDCFDKECVVEILAQKSSPLPSSFNAGLSILDEDMFWLQQTFRETNFSPERNDTFLKPYDTLNTISRIKRHTHLD